MIWRLLYSNQTMSNFVQCFLKTNSVLLTNKHQDHCTEKRPLTVENSEVIRPAASITHEY
jgi:hypothetical protein